MNTIVRFKPPRLALLYLGVSLVLHFLSRNIGLPRFSNPLAGLFCVVSGFGVMIWAWALFQAQRTAICPTSRATALIQTGPYRFTRNPMYLGILLMLCGAGFLLSSIVSFFAPVAFFLTMNVVFIPFEEQTMNSIFGEAYNAYRSSVRRWI